MSDKNPLHITTDRSGKSQVRDAEGLILRTLETRKEAELWAGEATRPSSSKR